MVVHHDDAGRPGLKAKRGRMGFGDPRRMFLRLETAEERAMHEAEDAAAKVAGAFIAWGAKAMQAAGRIRQAMPRT